VQKSLWHELTWRGLINQVTDPSLERLLDEERIVVYQGFDPTAPSLHFGHLLGLLTLRRFQEHGHRPIVVAGGATASIGDPGGRSSERNLLPEEVVAENLERVSKQLQAFLDFSGGDSSAVLLDNRDWLGPVSLIWFLREVGKHFSVNAMVTKDSVRARLEGGGISYTEFSYMLLQAYDYLHLYDDYGCRLQVGGSDQWANITAGVELIRRSRQETVFGLTTPLVVKADGTKMGKTASGAIWLDPSMTSPYAFYQFLLRAEDSMVATYLRYFTWLEPAEVAELEASTKERPEERAAQRRLAKELTALVHGAEAARRAEQASEVLFGGDPRSLDEESLLEAFSEAPSSNHPRSLLEGPGWDLVDALASVGLASSKAEARRLVAQRAVLVNNSPAEQDRRIGPSDLIAGRYVVLKRGKHRHHLLSFEA
jgi:tyrosyl-tRNA synthetase